MRRPRLPRPSVLALVALGVVAGLFVQFAAAILLEQAGWFMPVKIAGPALLVAVGLGILAIVRTSESPSRWPRNAGTPRSALRAPAA